METGLTLDRQKRYFSSVAVDAAGAYIPNTYPGLLGGGLLQRHHLDRASTTARDFTWRPTDLSENLGLLNGAASPAAPTASPASASVNQLHKKLLEAFHALKGLRDQRLLAGTLPLGRRRADLAGAASSG